MLGGDPAAKGGGGVRGAKRSRPPLGKVDIVHRLADRFGYRRYLEIATGTTGGSYALVDRGRFEACRRLLYRVAPGFDDGLAVDYREGTDDIGPSLAAIAAEQRPFDVMLVDPNHGYADSYRDIAAAFELLAPGGAIVVHDCSPPSEDIAGPDFKTGAWCGVTYKAFLDFVLGRTDLTYLTVDADFGCGVIRKHALRPGLRLLSYLDPGRRRLIARWRRLGDDYGAAWRLFAANRRSLLRLISADAFHARIAGRG